MRETFANSRYTIFKVLSEYPFTRQVDSSYRTIFTPTLSSSKLWVKYATNTSHWRHLGVRWQAHSVFMNKITGTCKHFYRTLTFNIRYRSIYLTVSILIEVGITVSWPSTYRRENLKFNWGWYRCKLKKIQFYEKASRYYVIDDRKERGEKIT